MSNIQISRIEIQEHPMALSIGDDDLCASCSHCAYAPGDLSLCKKQYSGESTEFPGIKDEEDTVDICELFSKAAPESNWVE